MRIKSIIYIVYKMKGDEVKHSFKITLLASAAAIMPSLVMATTLDAWNFDNVVPRPLAFPE